MCSTQSIYEAQIIVGKCWHEKTFENEIQVAMCLTKIYEVGSKPDNRYTFVH